jgi:hypothetical protein
MSVLGTGWKEVYLNGCQFAEAELIRRFMEDINEVQLRDKAKAKSPAVGRAFHAKIHAGLRQAKFVMVPAAAAGLPEPLQAGFFTPGTEYEANVRFSNASGVVQPDSAKDLRGIAIRVMDGRRAHDLLMTNAPASHARDARQFIAFAKAAAGGKLLFIPRLVLGVGLSEAIRMLKVVLRQSARPVSSLATEQFWSRSPYAVDGFALKFTLVPSDSARQQNPGSSPNYLREELAYRLKKSDVVYDFKVQLFRDEQTTPVEDGSVEWKELDAPFLKIGELRIPARDLSSPEAAEAEGEVNNMEFNPWNTTDHFTPIGSLNRARKLVYKSSAGMRTGKGNYERDALWVKIFNASIVGVFAMVNKIIPWHKLPRYIAVLNLLAFRVVLRKKNLYDTNDPHAPFDPNSPRFDPALIRARDSDGNFNDLNYPAMGCAGARFGRNVPRQFTYPDKQNLLEPSPREISRKLLRREQFIPAKSLNLLAAAWIQFQVHDWVSHFEPEEDNPEKVDLKKGDDWFEDPMLIRRTPSDKLSPGEIKDNMPPAYRNEETHWWDASQIYGDDKETEKRLRTHKDGKLEFDEKKHLLIINPETGLPLTGFTNNWWMGLYLFHALFTQEHNAICERLRVEYPQWDDEELFNTARLINCALMAKIHTVEWTPAILAHPAIKIALDANWWGLATETVHRLLGRISKLEAVSGIPGSQVNHQEVPFTLTEEFVAVYRLHPLIPEGVQLRKVTTGEGLKEFVPMENLAFFQAQRIFGCALFSEDEIKNLASLAQKLDKKSDHLFSDFLSGQLKKETKTALSAYLSSKQDPQFGKDAMALRSALVKDLNSLVASPSVLAGVPLNGVQLRAETQALKQEVAAATGNTGGGPGNANNDLARLNRMLLEDAYPTELKKDDIYVPGIGIADVIYSFGISNPGAITLHNYPDFLRDIVIPVASDDPDKLDAPRRIDLAATDIFRDRERGVPRYNKFRELLHRGRISSFDELTGNNAKLAQEIRDVYGTTNGQDNVDHLDLMVGMLAEPVPEGFGFSDTAFRIFILMASRRLKSDRFLTTDFTPEVYTQVGLDWISANGFSSILLRHYPELTPALRNLGNPFAPWNHVV